MPSTGLVDFDRSPAEAFPRLPNHVEAAPRDWVASARVVAGCPGDPRIMGFLDAAGRGERAGCAPVALG